MENTVLITASMTVPYLKSKKMIKQGLSSRFTVKDESGEATVVRFLDEMGREAPFNINHTVTLDLRNQYDSHNLAALKQRLAQDPELAKTVTIVDKEQDADVQNKKDLATAAAMAIINNIRNDAKTIQAIYRRKFGTVDGVTDTLILQSLFTLAKETPEELVRLNEAVKDEEGVFYDLLLENGVITVNDGIIKAANGTIVAKSKDAFYLVLRDNAGFKETLNAQLENVLNAKQVKANGVSKLIPTLLKAAATPTEKTPDEDDSNNTDAGMTNEQIVRLVTVAVKSRYFHEPKADQYEIPGRDTVDRKGLDKFYKANPYNAMELKRELLATGVYTEGND